MRLVHGDGGGLVGVARVRRAPEEHFEGMTVGSGHGRRLGAAGRGAIAMGLARGESLTRIAETVGVSVATVSREVRAGGGRNSYDPGARHAQARRARRRPKLGRFDVDSRLRRRVVEMLEDRFSPRQVCARLRVEYPGDEEMRVSAETIYQSLYVQGKATLRDLLSQEYRTRSGRTRRVRQRRIAGRTGTKPWLEDANISTRPASVEDRAVPGHWEGDLVVGAGNKTAMVTLVERVSRLVLIEPLTDRHDSQTLSQVMIEMIGRLPEVMRKSVTWDQGSEMARVAEIKTATGIDVYFCDPHSPWQRGTNENTNGLIREFFPKGADLSAYPLEAFRRAEELLNKRPRQTLGWATPQEAFDKLVEIATAKAETETHAK